MLAQFTGQLPITHTVDTEHVRRLVHEACEPVSQFWPMSRFVHHNPIHGLEHLPFDQAVREAKRLLGGNGYLPNGEYRQLYRDGRIAAASIARALERAGPPASGAASVLVNERRLERAEIWRKQLLFGFEPLDPVLFGWTLGAGSALESFPGDLPAESRRRILERFARDSGHQQITEKAYLGELWDTISTLTPRDREPLWEESFEVALPPRRTVGDWLEVLAGMPVIEQVNAQMTKWVAAFVDEGMAGWAMPGRAGGLYHAWRDLGPRDWSGRFLGIADFAAKIRRLPHTPEAAIVSALRQLEVPEERWVEYLSRHLAHLPGWAGLIRWLGENPGYPEQAGHPSDAVQYLAIRLFYEAELADVVCRRKWRIPGTVPALVSHWRDRAEEYQRLMAAGAAAQDGETKALCERAWPLFRLAQFLELTPAEVRELGLDGTRTLLDWLDTFPEDRHGPVWLEAYEDSYRCGLVALLSGGGRQAAPSGRPRAQLLLCIDVRSESFRRHIEAQGPYETHGYAGFFGVAMNHRAFDTDERFPLCPVLLKPKHAVDETVRPDQDRQLLGYASGTRWQRLIDHLLHDLKQNPLSSLMLVDVLGFFFSAGLAGKTLAPVSYESIKETIRAWFRSRVGTRIAVGGTDAHGNGSGVQGFTIAEQAGIVEAGLRLTGLTENFGRLIVLCGHGSVSDNNPYFGALHCGACGGKHGDANARAYATMANHPEVRALLATRGLSIPDDTWFVAAKHITTSDRVEFYDLEDVPATHREDLRATRRDLEKAGAAQALERCQRIPRAGKAGSPQRAYAHVESRTVDWANVRPEWGLSGNAAFIIARRSLTRGLNLQGRAFLHSYQPGSDPEGGLLEKIMTAPLIVAQWINMEHYFSGVDPWFWGSGSKVIHNVVSGVGVMLGNESDLQTGLPLQTVNNGAIHHHEPMRLLTVIEAPTARISAVIQKHALLQELLHNQWLNLVAVDPATFAFQRYRADGAWESMSLTESAGKGYTESLKC